MSLKRRFSPSPSSSPSDDIDSNITTPSTISPQSSPCLICGDKARIINYGALSCQSCKTFFRRNGFRPEVRMEKSLIDRTQWCFSFRLDGSSMFI